MLNFYWPIGLLVLSNVFYHITAKSLPAEVDAFFCMAVTYLVGAVISIALFLTIGNIVQAIFVAIALLIVGVLVYKEVLTATKVAGIAACLLGIILLNK